MEQYNRLRGIVAERFGTCERFSAALKWSGRKTRDIVSGRQIPNAKEIRQMAEALDVLGKPAEFMSIFFGGAVHNVDDQLEE